MPILRVLLNQFRLRYILAGVINDFLEDLFCKSEIKDCVWNLDKWILFVLI